MAKIIVFDKLDLESAEVSIDLPAGAVEVEVRYSVSSAGEGVALAKRRKVSDLLAPQDVTSILDIASRLKQALEAQELT